MLFYQIPIRAFSSSFPLAVLLLCSLLLCTGCHGFFSGVTPMNSRPPTQEMHYGETPVVAKTIVVSKKGETLSQIAHRYTGSAGNWVKIAKANPQINPQRIRVGQKITIPETLIMADLRQTTPQTALPLPKEVDKKMKSEARVAKQAIVEEDGFDVKRAVPNSETPDFSKDMRRASFRSRGDSISETPIQEQPLIEPSQADRARMIEQPKPLTKEMKKAQTAAKKSAEKTSRYRRISSSGYGSLNREVSRLDAELAKAEALAAQARAQQSARKVEQSEASEQASKKYFACSKNKCSVK